MKNMAKGLTVLKWVLINGRKYPQMSQKVWDFDEKRLHWASVVRVVDRNLVNYFLMIILKFAHCARDPQYVKRALSAVSSALTPKPKAGQPTIYRIFHLTITKCIALLDVYNQLLFILMKYFAKSVQLITFMHCFKLYYG